MDVLLNFPLQHLFANVGPWMSKQMYLVQGSVVALAGVLIYLVARGGRADRPGRGGGELTGAPTAT